MQHSTKSAIANIATAVALFVGTSALAIYALNVYTEDRGMDTLGLPPCETEDQLQPSCYWDADHQGNGEGLSFVSINGTITYEDGSTLDLTHELLPPCTDAIADAGGLCFGPLTD